MKSKFSYKSKRTIIIAAIITVLLAGTATGVYFFTKGNAQAQAAGDNNTTQEQYGDAPEENKNEQQNNTTENEQNKNEQGETTPNQQEEQETERQEQTTNNNQTTQNEQTTTTTTGEVPNQEYVTEREETVKNPWESLEVGWGPTQFASIASTANLTAKKSNLEIHKTVDKESVKIGDTLTYTISVKNNGDKVAKAIIYDNVPEGTVLLNKDNNEDENTKKLTWRVTVEPGETENVEFTVRVKAEKGTIKNSAIVNGKTTEETETGIINITGKKEVNTSEAKVGDTLTYTITLTNSGNATGTVTVTDEIPAGTTLVEKSITNNGVESNGTITWTDVEVKAGKTAEVSFKVTINSDTKTSVTNKAVIDGNKPTEEVETKIANITGAKSVDKSTAKVGETLKYTITLTNNGNADGKVTVTDEVPTGTRIKDENTTGYNKETNTMTWSNVEVKANGETATLTLEVVVKDNTTDTVKNVAKIDNKEIPEKPETKVANITGAKSVDKPTAKVGDILTYTIKLTNSGNGDGKVTVTDEIPTGTTLVADSITANGSYNEENKTITWTDVKVEAGKTAEVSFKVTINSDTKTSVTNKAVIDGNKPTEEVETKVANITTVKISTGKHADGTPVTDENLLHELDEITYTLTATNSGNADGEVILTDVIPEGTTLVENSISKPGAIDDNGKITWKVVVPAKNGEVDGKVEVSFTVKINPFKSGDNNVTDENGKTIRKIYNLVATQDGTTITPGTTDEVEKEYVTITVNKTWNDNETQAKRRPSKIRFELYAGSDFVEGYDMDTIKNDSYTFAKQPKYNSEGTVINYTVHEKEINTNDLKFYQSEHLEITDNNGNKTYNFTNTFRKPTDQKEITVTKIWEDNNDAAQKRPDEITLELNGKPINLTNADAEQNDGNKWSTKVNVDIYDDNGEEINYIATEKDVPQWYKKVEDGTTTVTNTFKAPTEEKYDITLEKIWDDNNNNAEKRPSSVKFDLYKINVNQEEELVEKDIELKGDSKTDRWSITKNVQKYDEKANVIEYFVVENETGSIFYEKTEQTGLSVTNKFTVPDTTTEIPVTKIWNDRNNVNRTDKVEFKITGNDSTNNSKTVELTRTNALAENGNVWATKVTELRKYNKTNGNEIEYSVEEINIPEGYIMTKNGNEITNSLPGIEVTKVVKKVNDIEAKGDITVKADDVIEYEITVKNIGTVELQDLTVTDNLKVYTNKEKPEVTTNTLAENVTLNVEETKNYTVYYKVTAEDAKIGAKTLRNTATASAKYTDSNKEKQTVEDYDNADVTIKELPGVEIVKTQKVNEKDVTESTKVEPGDVIDYTITVTNTGNTILNDVTVDDSMLNQKTFKTIEGKWEIGTLEIGSHVTIKAQYTVQEEDMEKGKVQNVATVETTSTEKKQDEVEVPTIEWKSDISVKKESKLVKKADVNTISGKAEYGDTIKYTITATNKGRKQGTIDITDKVPEGTTLKETNNDTNLTTEELGKLATTDGLTKTLTVAGNDGKNDGTESIYFEVLVTAKPGEKIQNIASASDGTEPEEPGYNVEKKVSVKKNTRIPKIKNSNVVIVLDVSGSMNYKPDGNKAHRHEETRLYAAQQACNNLIDSMFKDDSTGCQVSVVTFSSGKELVYPEHGYPYWVDVDNATLQGTATNSSEATTLKNKINDLTANGGTRIAAGINEANTEINRLAEKNKNNQNIVIVLSDGDFKVKDNGEIDKSAGETKSRVKTASRDLKTSKCAPTVYAVAFASSETGLMKNTIASDANKTFKTASDYTALLDIFTEIGSEIGGGEKVEVESNGGLIELPGLDENEDITIKLNGDTTGTTGRFGDDFFKDKIIKSEADGKYYLNTKAEGFDASDKIEIEYCEVEQGN